ILWVLFHVEVHGPLQTELSIFDDDGVLILRNAIDWSVECPIEDDARRFATEARIILSLEISRGLFSSFSQFASAIEPRARGGTASTRTATTARIGGPLSWFVLAQLIELYHTATCTAGINHHVLHGSPLSGDVRLSCWPS